MHVAVVVVVVAVVGCFATVRLFGLTRGSGASAATYQLAACGLYVVVALLCVVPELAEPLDLTPLQAEAIVLILFIVLAHGLVWEFMSRQSGEPDAPGSPG